MSCILVTAHIDKQQGSSWDFGKETMCWKKRESEKKKTQEGKQWWGRFSENLDKSLRVITNLNLI